MAIEAQAQNETNWLPLEPDSVDGINQSPAMLVLAILTPEIFVLYAYLALCWLCFSNYIDSHSQDLNTRMSKVNGTLVFRFIVYAMLVVQIVLITLYLAGVINALTILVELTTIELVFPICVVMLLMYYQCKFSGVPQSRYSETKTKALTTCVIIWSVLRTFQCWNGLYASRQFLGMSLLLSGYSYDAYLFVPFVLMIQFLVIEIIPFMCVLDLGFLDKMSEKNFPQQLTERLFEPQTGASRLDISQDPSSLPYSGDRSLYANHNSPFGQHNTPSIKNYGDNISDESSIQDYNSHPNVNNFSTNLGSFNETQYSAQSFNFPGSIFSTAEEFSLYEQFNKGEKQNPLGPLFKVKALDEEKQPAYPLIARVIYFKMVQKQVVDDIFREGTNLKNLNSRYLLPIEGMCFNKKTNKMHIFFPQKISLYEYVHESGVTMSADDKFTIAK